MKLTKIEKELVAVNVLNKKLVDVKNFTNYQLSGLVTLMEKLLHQGAEYKEEVILFNLEKITKQIRANYVDQIEKAEISPYSSDEYKLYDEGMHLNDMGSDVHIVIEKLGEKENWTDIRIEEECDRYDVSLGIA